MIDVTVRRGKALDFGGGQNGKWLFASSARLSQQTFPKSTSAVPTLLREP
jgi:hypothetical protein